MAVSRPRLVRYAQPFDKQKLNRARAYKVRQRRTGLPREWAANGWDYIGDSWRVYGQRLINIKGKRFWNLFVLRRDRTRSARAYAYWICQCDCGRRYSIRSDRLRNGTIVCCRECSKKVNELYKRMRDDARTAKQLIYGAKVNKIKAERLRIIRMEATEGDGSDTIYIKKVLTPAEQILQMRDIIGLKISEIAKEMNMTPEAVRLTLIDARSPLSDHEKDEVRSAKIAPDLVVEAQRAAPAVTYLDTVGIAVPIGNCNGSIRKKRFIISDTGSDGGMNPKQLREWMSKDQKIEQ